MKILYLIKSFAAKAGTERVLSDKMNWLADQGHQVFLVTYEQGNHPYAFPLNNLIIHYDLNTPFYRLPRYSFVMRLFLLVGFRCRFRKRLQCIVNDVEPDFFVTTSYSFWQLDIVSKIHSKTKRLIESHVACNKVRKTEFLKSQGVVYQLIKLFERRIFGCVGDFDGIVSLTKSDAKDWSVYNNNIYTIPNPVTFIPRKLANVGSNKRIICVGRLHEQKGFDLLIESFSLISDKCQEWNVEIFGEGGEEQALKKQISKYGLENRILIKPPVLNIYDEYMKSGFLVLSSRYEGFGLALVEAMSCGLPCVSFNCSYGPSDIIEDGVNGFLVENGDIRVLAERMFEMINNNHLRVSMGKFARQSVAFYQKDVVMQNWDNLFSSL